MAGFLFDGSAKQLQPVAAGRASRRTTGEIALEPSAARHANDDSRHHNRPGRGVPAQASGSESGRLRHFMRLRRDTARTNPELYDPLAAFLGVSMNELGRIMRRSDLDGLRTVRVERVR